MTPIEQPKSSKPSMVGFVQTCPHLFLLEEIDRVSLAISDIAILGQIKCYGIFILTPSGKTISEVIEAGRAKLGSVPSSGAVASAPASGTAEPAAAAPAAAEPAKEEKKDESGSESGSDDDMGFGLFD